MANLTDTDITTVAINTIRTLAMDTVQKANSGHPGTPMGAAAMAYTVWTRFLRHDPNRPDWFDRDRFVLSPGHASVLLYSLLHLTGYDISLEDLKNFRQLGSKTPGHPERGHTPGVELTTGPLGAGFSMGVGLAIAERFLAENFNRPSFDIVNHWTYGIVSDGDLMEGVASEAASLAGTLGLGRIIYLYDDNDISIEGNTDIAFAEEVGARFEAYGWHVSHVSNGNDVEAIARAIETARQDESRPSLIVTKTRIGFGSPKLEGTPDIHGSPMGAEEIAATKRALNWSSEETFHIPGPVLDHYRQAVSMGATRSQEWYDLYSRYAAKHPGLAGSLTDAINDRLPEDWDADIPRFEVGDSPEATRVSSGKVLNGLVKRLPTLVGGSADLAPSTNTYLFGYGDLGLHEWCGRNMHFGVREHAMGGVVNGMALHGGIIPYGATFLVFSDYMRPALRLAALQGAHSIYVFTHDSIGLGEDGPTHQPVEHLASLRAIPGFTVYRPADANETAECWRLAIQRRGPCALILSRQALPVLDPDLTSGASRGAYVLAGSESPEAIIMATGSEVEIALAAHELLKEKGIASRVVSMPGWEVFEAQSDSYKREVLPPGIRARVAVEAALPMGWWKYLGTEGRMVGMNSFGASGKASDLYEHFGITPDAVVRAVADSIADVARAGST